MDIKDFILIGGGLLIAAVIVHGFWIAWRARRDPLRLDLVKTTTTVEEGDDLGRLRAELPNGGARVVTDGSEPRQKALELGAAADGGASRAPVLLEASDDDLELPSPPRARGAKTEPRLDAPAGPPEPAAADAPATTADPSSSRGKVADVIMPERPIKADEPKEPRRWSARKTTGEMDAVSDVATAEDQRDAARQARSINRLADRGAAEAGRRQDADTGMRPGARGRDTQSAERSARGTRGAGQSAGASQRAEPAVEELIMINVLAPKGSPFVGGGLVETMRARGLRYGDMNIFHRVDPMTRANLYSVANVVEPGTFDMADLDNFRSPGVCFFMQLPGPEQPADAFEDMLKVARDVAVRMGGSLFDEQRSVMTGQTVEHYRQRISDYCRRRMSMRA